MTRSLSPIRWFVLDIETGRRECVLAPTVAAAVSAGAQLLGVPGEDVLVSPILQRRAA